MSPSSARQPATQPAADALARLFVVFGARIRDERLARRWSLHELASRACLSPATVHSIEGGAAGSLDACVRLAAALSLRLDLLLTDPRRRDDRNQRDLAADVVHSAMGELEAGHLRRLGFGIGVDEPYQHFQFAGRADVVAWDLPRRALLHIENRTRFPDLQEVAGSFNAKRAYLGRGLAERLGIRGWRSETHVLAALWSAEILHALRLRTETFRALCPDPPDAFAAWWSTDAPGIGTTSTLIVLDPAAGARQRLCVGLDAALTAKPRHRGYAEAAAVLARPAA